MIDLKPTVALKVQNISTGVFSVIYSTTGTPMNNLREVPLQPGAEVTLTDLDAREEAEVRNLVTRFPAHLAIVK